MGYVKRDAPSAPRLHAKKREEERLAEKRTPLPKPPPIKTEKEKEELRVRKINCVLNNLHIPWKQCCKRLMEVEKMPYLAPLHPDFPA